jgi:hypothetical protein
MLPPLSTYHSSLMVNLSQSAQIPAVKNLWSSANMAGPPTASISAKNSRKVWLDSSTSCPSDPTARMFPSSLRVGPKGFAVAKLISSSRRQPGISSAVKRERRG